ncbi:MAG: prepilin-type N-terminal cleavage/methylation domain-containing protein [Clostridia bacterium]|nr:prepilin-type N-terminal cleavage/methylation domain-containing protein [Clostridia bacterium]
MKNKGFSLVELIVVIAIMAILVGVAVPVYTSYIGKAQKNKDIQMVDEVKHAIEIALVAKNPDNFAGGVAITFDTDGCELVGGSTEDRAIVEEAMNETFGTSWETTLKLSYEDWEEGTAQVAVSNYVGSTFDGKEEDLLNQIQNLSKMLSIAANSDQANLIGNTYKEYLATNGLTSETAMGNAAVLYIAENMSGVDEAAQNAIASGMVQVAYTGASDDLIAAFNNANIRSRAPLAAAVYASYEGYFQYLHFNGACDLTNHNDETCPLKKWRGVDYSNIQDIDGALSQIAAAAAGAKSVLATEAAELAGATYLGIDVNTGTMNEECPAKKDALAFIATMDAVDESSAALLPHMDSETCYNDGQMLTKLETYMSIGGAKLAILLNGSDGGYVSVTVYPAELG